MPPPKFDTSSPLMVTPPAADTHWAVRVEEKAKFDGIFDSLLPVGGLLSGEKVRPVLVNSKLPLDVLGRVWDLSDIDRDGHLDRDEFAVAMHLVYRALEKEPVPAALPPALVPPAKRRKPPAFPGAVPVLPASPPPHESLRSTPSHGSASSLNSAGSLSPKAGKQATGGWVVPAADKLRFDDIFLKTDQDQDGYVSGQEAKDIFIHSGLGQGLLAHIWALADTQQTGKLNKEQFALAMFLIQRKVSKGLDPPQVLPPDMVPPSERSTPGPDGTGSLGEFAGVKELEDISQEVSRLQREKLALEQDIRDKEEAARQKASEVQELQAELDREAGGLQELETQKQEAQQRLQEMEQQKSRLRGMLGDARAKCQGETRTVSALRAQIQTQEAELRQQEAGLGRARADLARLQEEETQLEQSLRAGRAQLATILRSLRATHDEIGQARSRLSQLQLGQQDVHRSLEQLEPAAGGASLAVDDPFKNKALLFSNPQDLHPASFQAEDPFKSDPFRGADPFKGDPFVQQPTASTDPFGGDPFQESDPFQDSGPDDFFKKQEASGRFSADPFSKNPVLPAKLDPFEAGDPFSSAGAPAKGSGPFSTPDPFGSGAFGSPEGFADFSHMAKPPTVGAPPVSLGGPGFPEAPSPGSPCEQDTPILPPKKPAPPRPKGPSAPEAPSPPRYSLLAGTNTPVSQLGAADFAQPPDPFQPVDASLGDPFQAPQLCGAPFGARDPFAPGAKPAPPATGFADFTSLGDEEQQLVWAKRESEKAERERLARLWRQEQEDVELAIALSRADMPAA
ncbi:epidermal growth factor receptor substrate 15-like 1 isoform X1 [Erinaceus europaeus]|uniref:Epidermal growth factor receptor substrate 15-like 1 isoform X1 n=1 Tax=Erinaceus europaeus TaxID=9365 RepID=A0ABM3WV43_ERIEU|nr:epidermal growth factor receptor substrate 15-like 1 isoform X1 [Erinaceus europaeus]